MAVDSFKANPWGLYNVHGNVWEWVEDCYHPNYEGAPSDGSAWTTKCEKLWGRSILHVLRGGSWFETSRYLRSETRTSPSLPQLRVSNVGFRLARTLD